MDRWLHNCHPLYAIGDDLHAIGSSPGAVSFRMRVKGDSVLIPSTKCEAYTFLVGSLGSLILTLWFLPVL